MTIINLTPHAINFLREDNSVLATVEPNQCSYGAVTGLPDPQPETIYLVSALTAQACRDRNDVFITDDAVRNESGQIIGCRAIAHI